MTWKLRWLALAVVSVVVVGSAWWWFGRDADEVAVVDNGDRVVDVAWRCEQKVIQLDGPDQYLPLTSPRCQATALGLRNRRQVVTVRIKQGGSFVVEQAAPWDDVNVGDPWPPK